MGAACRHGRHQHGRQPRDVDLTLGAGETREIRIELVRVATRLAAVRVADEWECRAPGRPLPKDADVYAAFEQLEQNAERLRLLAAMYPHVIEIERRYASRRQDGVDLLERVDTITVESESRSRYRAGRMIVAGERTGRTRAQYLRLPTLLDLASPEFQRSHCFLYRGADSTTGETLLRIDFKASSKLRTADVHGTAYLDTTTYMLKRADVRLSRVPRELRGLADVRVTTLFAELRPGLPIIAAVSGVNQFESTGLPRAYSAAIEDQRPLVVRFLGAVPK